MGGTTGMMMFDFLFFREQLCLIACPYGRFQSVMLDRQSLIVAYDPGRGEPRKKGSTPHRTRRVTVSTVINVSWFVPPGSTFAMDCRWNALTARNASTPVTM